MRNGFKMLLKPIKVGSLQLSNRIVRGPILSRTSSVDGEVTQQLIDMYENAAKGGPAMIIIEATAISGRFGWKESHLRIDDPKYISGLRRVVEAIHLNGVACEFQINCLGAFGREPISPSGVPCYGVGRVTYVQPRVLSTSEVEEIRDLFIEAAIRIKATECEGVVLHGASSYLLQQFVSPHTNKRTDKFGGSFENRVRLPLEIVRGIRRKCGPYFVIGYSMVIDELLPDGVNMEESLTFANALKGDRVDHIDLMVGTHETGCLEKGVGRSNRQRKGLFEEAEIFKRQADINVFARCSGQHDPYKWEEALEKRQCDVIQIARPLLSDPELPKKIREGRFDDIRLCVNCAYCYENVMIKGYQVACSLNAEIGKEKKYFIKSKPVHSKHILVIGGGPGGLEAGRIAALRGHQVTLMEKEAELGGNARIASLPSGKMEIMTYFIDWLERQCRKAGVTINLNREVSAKLVKQSNPDAVIVATGATPLIPSFPGVEKPFVITAEDILNRKASARGKVIIAGGGQVGVEVADFIAENNNVESLTIIDMLPVLATDMPAMLRTYLLQVLLPKHDIKVLTSMQIYEITEEGIETLDTNGKMQTYPADTVVIALGYVPNISLVEELKGEIPELYMIGDCVKARNIFSAVHEAAYVARQI
jgi:2,4-dienoyl-CoA reductase-like NADH-dependent reductase (Old Yellow Enzyme family)/thioredoxin reductase